MFRLNADSLMHAKLLSYSLFALVLLAALFVDLGLLSKRSHRISMRQALVMTLFWIALSLGFSAFLWFEFDKTTSLTYLGSYLMEWSLSLDNIFIFILIFRFFKTRQEYVARVLLVGILLAIVFRVLFIGAGIFLVARFHWILYLFGGFLVYTGIRMMASRKDHVFSPADNKVYAWALKFLRITEQEPQGKFILVRNKKAYFTTLSMVVLMLAGADIIFALDSIPAVFAITRIPLLVYTSNIMAVLGLRSLFFLLQGAAARFRYLKHGIASVLLFVGIKMLAEIVHVEIPILVSLMVIVICLTTSIAVSLLDKGKRETPIKKSI